MTVSSSDHVRNVLAYSYASFTETLLKLVTGVNQFHILPDTLLISSSTFEDKVSQTSFTPVARNS